VERRGPARATPRPRAARPKRLSPFSPHPPPFTVRGEADQGAEAGELPPKEAELLLKLCAPSRGWAVRLTTCPHGAGQTVRWGEERWFAGWLVGGDTFLLALERNCCGHLRPVA
jgi:hypothetical protein